MGGGGGGWYGVFSPRSSPDLDPTTDDTTKTFQSKPYPGRWNKMQQEGFEGTQGNTGGFTS